MLSSEPQGCRPSPQVRAASETLVDEADPSKGSLSIRCGIHSGAIVGTLIGQLRPKYTLLGGALRCAALHCAALRCAATHSAAVAHAATAPAQTP